MRRKPEQKSRATLMLLSEVKQILYQQQLLFGCKIVRRGVLSRKSEEHLRCNIEKCPFHMALAEATGQQDVVRVTLMAPHNHGFHISGDTRVGRESSGQQTIIADVLASAPADGYSGLFGLRSPSIHNMDACAIDGGQKLFVGGHLSFYSDEKESKWEMKVGLRQRVGQGGGGGASIFSRGANQRINEIFRESPEISISELRKQLESEGISIPPSTPGQEKALQQRRRDVLARLKRDNTADKNI